MSRNAVRAAATAAALTLALLADLQPAAAGTARGVVSASESVASGSWAATASAASLVFTATTDQTSTITNTGTIALAAISYKVTVSNPASGSPTFTVYACTVAWSANKCSGGAGTQVGGTLAKNSTTTVTSAVVPPLSGAVYLQVQPAAVTSSVTVTLGTSVTAPAQLRAAVKTDK